MLKRQHNEPTLQADFSNRLHDPDTLPDHALMPLAARAVDILYGIEQILQPPQLILEDQFLAYMRSKCLVTAVSFKIPDLVSSHGEMTVKELADAAGLHGNGFYDIARGIPTAVHKDTNRILVLHRTLGGGAVAQAPGIVADYPWHEIGDKTILDVGGSGGALITSLLRANPNLRGGVFDLPCVIEHIRPFFEQGGQFADVGDRVSKSNLIAGDFFSKIPSYEVYILRNIREAMTPGEKSRLVVLESVMQDGEMGSLSQYGDINMMMTAKGQERTVGNWHRLAASAGWHIFTENHVN
ncbi:S-adenosyl-L-methionine-dependent methyltransferase [Aspergillus leporis]|uniref:S-adenosyl-L-methionine-dependent methyltransferase n=1 Tax=Aspergillus leporis TaxID=41062 RepID=A0A5N5WKN0_9EURO|nr:S-adenosyl-L-methionine-dependent methyltransferase [Aspergillus leporis]